MSHKRNDLAPRTRLNISVPAHEAWRELVELMDAAGLKVDGTPTGLGEAASYALLRTAELLELQAAAYAILDKKKKKG